MSLHFVGYITQVEMFPGKAISNQYVVLNCYLEWGGENIQNALSLRWLLSFNYFKWIMNNEHRFQ